MVTLAIPAGSQSEAPKLASVRWIHQQSPYQSCRAMRRSLVHEAYDHACPQADRGNRFSPTSASPNPRRNPHSARGNLYPQPTAISCLGAFRTPAAGARGGFVIPASENLHMKRREQVQRNCQCASTSRQKTHQAKADRAPRFRQCLIIAPRSSTCRVDCTGASDQAPITAAWRASRRPGTGQQRRARRRGVQSRAQAYVFNVFGWLAEAARS